MYLKKKFTKCKVTGQKIPIIFNFGKMPIANNFSQKVEKKNLYEMKIAFNENNGLFQLVNAPNPKKIFNDSYAFMSSTSNSMKIHFKNVASKIKKLMKKNSKIMEIGCNDGIFLQNFKADLTILLDLDVKIAQKRILKRNEEDERFEKFGLSFHQKIRSSFLNHAKHDPAIKVIDASINLNQVSKIIKTEIESLINA